MQRVQFEYNNNKSSMNIKFLNTIRRCSKKKGLCGFFACFKYVWFTINLKKLRLALTKSEILKLNKSPFLDTQLLLLLIRADFTVLAPCASQRENCLLFSDVAYTTRSSVTPRGAQTGLHNYRVTHHNINKLYPAVDSPTDTHVL